jgi:hypothetical protein
MAILANNSLDLHPTRVGLFEFINPPEGRATYNLHDKTNCDNLNKICLAVSSGENFPTSQARPELPEWQPIADRQEEKTGGVNGQVIIVRQHLSVANIISLIFPLIAG